MYFDPYLARRLAEERIKERLREAERERLIRTAQGPQKARGWWTSVALMLSNLVRLAIPPQS